ncbi:MAG: GIY-YIG nuclease family protein [Firmicutes bacterium]|nr:GIY-YIG nuclease family protein [Bacillota bacterium]
MYYIYILSNDTNVTVYVGVTNDLERRLWEHRHHTDLEREKQLKSWNRRKKNELIQRMNPMWHDLSPQSSDKE